MAQEIRIKGGTRAQLESAKANSGLIAREPYLITDERRLAVGTSSSDYEAAATQAEVAAMFDGINKIEVVAAEPVSPVAGVLYLIEE